MLAAQTVGGSSGSYSFENGEHMDLHQRAAELLKPKSHLTTEHKGYWVFHEEGNTWNEQECREIIELCEPARGIQNWRNHDFTVHEIAAIRAARKHGEGRLPLKVLAQRYNCSKALISKIANRKIYTNV